MLARLRSTLLASGGAVILVVSASGLAAAATLVGDTAPTTDTQVTTSTFVDSNGDGIDDTCQTAVVAGAAAALAAMTAADTNGDGTISVSEAAHTDWIGGKNCNHGGYVSGVAHTSGADCGTPQTPAGSTGGTDGTDQGANDGTTTLVKADGEQGDEGSQGENADPGDQGDQGATDTSETENDASDCSTDTTPTTTDQTTTPPVCLATTPAAPPAADLQAPTDTAPNAHGKAVSLVAQSTAVGGKNCNHGGAVSEAAHQNKAADNAAKHPHGKGHGKGHNKNN